MPTQVDLYLDSLIDAPLRDDRTLMEFPFFAITKRPQMEITRFEKDDVKIVITPSPKGAATIWDRDILIYVASILNDRIERGLPVGPTVRFAAHDLLRSTQRGSGKRSYELLKDALFRLRATSVETNIESGNLGEDRGFGWIANYTIQYDIRPDKTKRMTAIEVHLCNWMFRAVSKDRRVLSISGDYFALTGGLERRLYQLARKHCGRQREWKILLPNLAEKVGTSQDLRFFKRDLKKIIEDDRIPGYRFGMVGDPTSDLEAGMRAEGYKLRQPAGNGRILVIVSPRESEVLDPEAEGEDQ